jgi:hypothetical protein
MLQHGLDVVSVGPTETEASLQQLLDSTAALPYWSYYSCMVEESVLMIVIAGKKLHNC